MPPKSSLFQIGLRGITFMLGLGICLLQVLPAWADSEGSSSPTASWVLGYFLLFLGIALGLIAICRPCKRSKEMKMPEE